MKLLMYGFNNYTMTSAEEESYQFNEADLKQQLADISQMPGNLSVVIFNNEFRTEYYMKVEEEAFNHGDFLRYLSDKVEADLSETIAATYSVFNQDLIEHLITIFSGRGEEDLSFSQLFSQADASLRLAQPFQAEGETTFRRLFAGVMKLAIQFLTSSSLTETGGDMRARKRLNLFQFIDQQQMKRVVLFGESDKYLRLAKDLYLLGVKSIVFISEEIEKNQKIVAYLNHWQNQLFPEDANHYFKAYHGQEAFYFVSSADGLIFTTPFQEAIYFTHYRQPAEAMRQFDKKQATIILDDMTARNDIANENTKELVDIYQTKKIENLYGEDNFDDYFSKKVQDFTESVLIEMNE